MTPEKIQQTIELLEQIDPWHEYAYETAFRALLGIGGLPAVVYGFKKELIVFRTRTHDEDVQFSEIKEILNPPGKFVQSFARCNRPFQSKFYGSENRQTSFMELVNSWCEKKEVGDELFATIGRWLIKSPVDALIIVNPNIDARVTDFDKAHGAGYDEMIRKFPLPIQQSCHLFYSYLFEKFRKVAYHDPLVYIITSAYCNATLSTKEAKIDAVCYPSVPFMEQGLNFAFNKDYIRPTNIELLGAMRNKFIVGTTAEGKKAFTETEAIMVHSVDIEGQLINWA